MKIRRCESGDMPAIMAIQERLFPPSQWSASDYSKLCAEPEGLILVAENETATPPKVLGFAALRRVADEAELLFMAVDPDHQAQGIGKALLQEALARLRKEGARRLFLEVRVSNKRALRLYRALGFTLHTLRKGYYREPLEDAYVMSLELISRLC
ncbi:MAG TPA: ribosomal protein S18-alanine N-acetyltransferase [Terriglobia bacterium]|jgi:ribosomal-protein-alanine N-acetyltransferase|nr:ribosomal protein S18-alanine N-acetyltransferase [Terriglobia bacterium]